MMKRLLCQLVLFLMAGVLVGQELPPGLAGPPVLQFSFSNPGARSLGFGGAFAALADDATATFANPAGLIQITKPEVSLEGRSWGYSTPFTESARVEGEPTGIGVDTLSGSSRGISSIDLAGLSFLSFVYPMDNGSIAFYRHQLADFESLSETQGLFGRDRFLDQRERTDLEIVSYGLSGALRASDVLSVGLSLVYFRGLVSIVNEPFLPDPDDTLGAFAPTSYLPGRMVLRTELRVDDSEWGLTGGFLLTLSPRWRLGGFYRQGPSLEMNVLVTAGPGAPLFGLPPAGTFLEVSTTPAASPDVYGLGASFRTEDGRLTVAFEWDRVEYSTILDSLDPEVLETPDLLLEDGNEFRLGAECVFVRAKLIAAARAGLWLDPSHLPSVTAVGTALEQALRPPGSRELHSALGFGLASESFQIDLAVDLSELVDTVSVSAIYSF